MKKVVVWTIADCVYCDNLKEWLRGRRIPYDEKMIGVGDALWVELDRKMGGRLRGVPVVEVDGELIEGFDLDKMEGLFKD